MKKTVIVLAVGLTGCAMQLETKTVELPTSGRKLDYVHYRSDTNGCSELVSRDVYDWEGRLIDTKQAVNETAGCQIPKAIISGGAVVGGAAALRPTRINEQNFVGSANSQGQEQSYEGYTESSSGSVSTGSTATATGGNAKSSSSAQGGAGGNASSSSSNPSSHVDKVKHPKGNNGYGNGGHDGSPNGKGDKDR